MGILKIPDKSDFLKKYAAVEHLLQKQPVEVQQATTNVSPAEGTILNKNELVDFTQAGPANATVDLKCSQCGIARRPADIFCMNCGNKHASDPGKESGSIGSTTDSPNVVQKILKCSNCGTPHAASDSFCKECGNKL